MHFGYELSMKLHCSSFKGTLIRIGSLGSDQRLIQVIDG